MDPITGTLANQHLGNSDVSLIVSILEELVKLPEETLLKQFEQVLLPKFLSCFRQKLCEFQLSCVISWQIKETLDL